MSGIDVAVTRAKKRISASEAPEGAIRAALHGVDVLHEEMRRVAQERRAPTAERVAERRPAYTLACRGGAVTSLQAALSQTTAKRQTLYLAIHSILEESGPLTHEELYARLGKVMTATPSGVRTRCSELAAAGWVRDTGEKRKTTAGHPSIVWAVSE